MPLSSHPHVAVLYFLHLSLFRSLSLPLPLSFSHPILFLRSFPLGSSITSVVGVAVVKIYGDQVLCGDDFVVLVAVVVVVCCDVSGSVAM